MPVVTKQQALELLINEVQEKLGADELLEVHNEIFPEAPFTEEEADDNCSRISERLVDFINGGLASEEIVDLWGLIFPTHRNVWYDDEEEQIHYNEEAEAVSTE